MSSRVFLCLPALVYVLATVFAHQRGDDRATGDEPHYLQLAESIANDADLDLHNNRGSFGPLASASHCVERGPEWFSIHNIGLPALVALPWAEGGHLGARLALALFAGLSAPLLYQVINSVWRQPRGSRRMALALALGMPLVHASSQVYPDLPAGILLLFVAGGLLGSTGKWPDNRHEDPVNDLTALGKPAAFTWQAVLVPAALAFLPWLHIKYAGAALVACGWYAVAGRWKGFLSGVAALAGSLALLGCYNWHAFGNPSGPYAETSPLDAGLNSFIVFMGLHFDQAQGMFLQQPLWLLGLVGLAPMWRASRRNCVLWVLLYAAAILPNAMHPNWYGGYSFIGRFGATAVLLWAIPLAYAARSVFADDLRVPSVLAAVSLAFQFWLAGAWLTGGESLINQCDRPEFWRPCIWAYNGFFPHSLRDYLPYWQPFVAFWHYPANFAAWIASAGLLLYGLFQPWRPVLAARFLLATLLLAVSLTAAMSPEAAAVCAGDQLPQFAGIRGSNVQMQRVAKEGVDAAGPVALAQTYFLRPGDYCVAVDFQAQAASDPVGYVMFHDGKELAMLSVLNQVDGHQQNVSQVHVPRGQTRKPSTFVIWYTGHGTLSIARLGVERRRR